MKKPLINEFNDLLINNDSLDAISQDYKKKISKEIKVGNFKVPPVNKSFKSNF